MRKGRQKGQVKAKSIISDPLIAPYKITVEEGKVVLTKWLSSLTKDREFMISSDKILTMSDPAPTILEKYIDLVDKK